MPFENRGWAVSCDFPECDSTLETQLPDFANAKSVAVAYGWKIGGCPAFGIGPEPMFDWYCPDHAYVTTLQAQGKRDA